MSHVRPAESGSSEVKELRFAVVLYGGVSLAIYMHGTTKEIHRLVSASALLDANDASMTPSERVYRELLLAKAADEKGVRTRVVVDTIAGTSAGGINGVYLAKALAHDLPQERLRNLWFDRGDIASILRGPQWVPWKLRTPWVLAMLWRTPPLAGDRMSLWLFEALQDMDRPAEVDRTPRSLVPPGHELQLFVTLTDFHGYPRELIITDPPVVYDHRHRHVMEFRYGDGHDDFRPIPLDNAALAFAARATSCFPGAFPPVDFATFEGCLRRVAGASVDLSAMAEGRLFRQYPLSHAEAGKASFIDGGVLDNRPFGHAIRAIRQKPASVEVDRRLLYLDPNPANPQGSPGGAPRPIASALASLSGLPRTEPILDEILEVGTLNERVRQIRDVIKTNWSPIADLVEQTLQDEDLANPPADPSDARLLQWGDRIHERSITEAGVGYATYVRVKVGDAVDTWAWTICRLLRFPSDSSQAAFVRTVLREWANRADLFQKASVKPTPAQVEFLRDLDLGYGERRLRFMIAALSWWYDPDEHRETFPVPSRSQLDQGKKTLYEAAEELRAAQRGEGIPDNLARQLASSFGEQRLEPFVYQGTWGVDSYLDEEATELAALASAFRAHLQQRLTGFGARAYTDVHDLVRDWDPEARRRLMLRYLGFPFWDVLLFPLQALVRIGERDHVDIIRLSPRDASILKPPGGKPKLVGVRHQNFGAFFDRAGREKDYLWGRLDGAERMVKLLADKGSPKWSEWCYRAFRAVLEEEAEAVPNAADLVEHIRQQIPAPTAEPD